MIWGVFWEGGGVLGDLWMIWYIMKLLGKIWSDLGVIWNDFGLLKYIYDYIEGLVITWYDVK